MYLKSVITTRRVLKMIFLKNFGEPAAFKVDYICSKVERQQLASKKKKKKRPALDSRLKVLQNIAQNIVCYSSTIKTLQQKQ